MRKPKLATFFTVAQAGSSFLGNVPSLAITATVQPPTTSVGGSAYVFTKFIAPVPIGKDTNDGSQPTQGAGNVGPYSLGSLISPVSGSPTAQQIANNAAMAGQVIGLVGDQGPLNALSVMAAYPLKTGSGNVFDLPAGLSASQPTILASCNSSRQYVRGLAVLDGGATGAEYSSMNLIGRFAITAGATDAQYITIDGIEVKNAMNGGIVFGISAATGNCPGWVAKNCEVHHVYNCSAQFTATGCSMSNGSGASGNQLVIGAVTSGTVHFGVPGQDQLLSAPFPGVFINGFVSGTPGGAGTYTCSGSALVPGPNNLTGSAFAGSNTAGISFHGGSGHIQTNNYIHDIIDLNTAASTNPNNQRAVGIKNWTCINGSATFNTIYATAATGYPSGGIEHKNVPQYNNTIANNYINLVNAVNVTGVDILGIAGDGESGQTVTVINGHFYNINNNIIIASPHGNFGFSQVAGGSGAPQAILVNWFSNTMVGGTGNGGFQRAAPVGQRVVTYYDNIIDRVSPPSGGNGGDFLVEVDIVNLIDYNLYPNNYLLASKPSGGGSIKNYSSGLNGGVSGLMTDLTTGSGGATTGLEHNGTGAVTPELGSPQYQNASGTKLKATDWKIAPTSPVGFQTGRTGGTSAGAVIDKGAWGGQTQIGCNFKDPSG